MPSLALYASLIVSTLLSVLGGLAYIYMVATWGGFVFVINLVGVHAGLLCALGRYSSKLHRAYSLFYFIGTAGALRVPVVGMGPLKSMEQLGPLFVFLGMQLLEFCEIQRRSKNLSLTQLFVLRLKVFGVAGAVVVAGIAALYPTGYFGPLSARVRGLFVKHTRTGNPLVDSVAEHQPASAKAYEQYLHHVYHLAPVGLAISCLKLSDANTFLIVYAVVAYYFSSKMARCVAVSLSLSLSLSRSHIKLMQLCICLTICLIYLSTYLSVHLCRLIVLLGPVAAALGGVAVGFAYDQLFFVPMATLGFREAGFKVPKEVGRTIFSNFAAGDNDEDESSSSHSNGGSDGAEDDGGQAKSKLAKKAARRGRGKRKSEFDKLQDNLSNAQKVADSFLSNRYVLFVRLALAMLAFTRLVPSWNEFFKYSHDMARGMSHPQLMFQAQLRDGTTIIVDDYREAYWWLRDNTPADSRVMSWWDYGYQIAGIANRTTLADGNTWNHEHIATLGRILVSTEKESHRIARHLADYVLVWAGGGGDDLAKSPHMARIGNSVFPDLCPGDPTCSHFGFYQGGTPTPMMEKSLLYKLTQYGIRPEVKIDPNRYTHAFTSKYGKVRIFKINSISRKSKKWIADPKNRLCDVPGSWMCRGQVRFLSFICPWVL